MTADDPAWPALEPGVRHDAPDPPEAFRVPFTVFDALAMVLLSQVVGVLIVGVSAAVGVDVSASLATTASVILVIQTVALAAVLGFLRLRGVLSWRLLGPIRPAARHLAIGLGIGVSGWIVVTVLVEMANRTFGPVPPPEQSLMEAGTSGGLATVLSIVSAVFLAPIVEEVVYRGGLFQSLRQTLGLFPAMFISSGVFALVHLELGQPLFLAGLMLLGLWLAAAFHRTGSLLVPIVGHATFNAISLTFALLVGPG